MSRRNAKLKSSNIIYFPNLWHPKWAESYLIFIDQLKGTQNLQRYSPNIKILIYLQCVPAQRCSNYISYRESRTDPPCKNQGIMTQGRFGKIGNVIYQKTLIKLTKIIVSSILRMYWNLKGLCVALGHFVPGQITQATVSLDQSNYLIIMLKSYRLVGD